MMRSFQRYTVILGALQSQPHVTIEAMAAACGTSLQTIRRDLNHLVADGKIRRYHGGAVLANQAPLPSYAARSSSHVEQKKAAASLLVDQIPDGSSLFIAGGSTLALAAQRLRDREGLTIITNNLHAAFDLFDQTGFEMHVVGGMMRPASGSMTGEEAVRFIERFSADFAVIGTSGIDSDGALLEFDQSVVGPVMSMIANAKQTILVADSSKFSGNGLVRSAHIRDIDHLVTDRSPPGPLAELLAANGVTVHVPSRLNRAEVFAKSELQST